MATPVKRTEAAAPQATGPVPVLAPLGWIITLMGGIGLILATWLVYPTDADGMWAGYRDGLLATVVIMTAMALRTSLPRRPLLGLLGLCGVLVVFFAVFIDDGHKVFVASLSAGIVILVGTACQAAADRH